MARRASPPDRAACESALGPDLVGALHELCDLVGVSRLEWHKCPAIARLFETAAFQRTVERLRDDGETQEQARIGAAIRLGLESEETPISRVKRWTSAA